MKTLGRVLLLLLVIAAMLALASCDSGDDDDDDNNDDTAGGDDDDNDDDNDDDDNDTGESTARLILSLNGTWDVEQGEMGDTPPAQFQHTVPVPALLTAATPAFEQVGANSELREAFWYRTVFDAPDLADADVAILNIHKAKYGIAVWLNGAYVGDHFGSFTLASFDVIDQILPGQANTLLIRVGDYLDSVPKFVPAGQDIEKTLWIPGIYDDVELVFSATPHIVRVKVEPNIDNETAKVITFLKNDLNASATISVENQVLEWAEETTASEVETVAVTLEPGEERAVEQVIPIENARLWSTDDPFLYVVRSRVLREGATTDNLETRFGYRKVQWLSGEHKGFYLNNEKVFLRGSNITLHRFFEDKLCSTLPWNEDWVRQLLTVIPKQLNWNTFRISLGRAPNFWYDIADETGLLLADEFMMWDFLENDERDWSVEEMSVEFAEWIQESWNHPSIAWWDSSNESFNPIATQAMGHVRHLDWTRQWENGGFKAPYGPNDPIEDHPYIFFTLFVHNDADDIDDNDGLPPQGGIPALLRFTHNAPEHPYINNEYGWLWISRTGAPTYVSWKVYYDILGPGRHSPDVYREAYAYLVGGQTAFWRAKRGYEGIMQFSHLGYDRPWGNTCDNFIDVENLVLEPRWFEYATNAFSPHMIYIDSWQENYPPDETVQIPVQVINDYPYSFDAAIQVMAVDDDGNILSQSAPLPISLDAYGAGDYQMDLQTPLDVRYTIFAKLSPDDQTKAETWSRRKVGYGNIGEVGPDPPF